MLQISLKPQLKTLLTITISEFLYIICEHGDNQIDNKFVYLDHQIKYITHHDTCTHSFKHKNYWVGFFQWYKVDKVMEELRLDNVRLRQKLSGKNRI